jgi:pyroglutamyl-peptidase
MERALSSLLAACAAGLIPAAEPTVLVTAFGPFAGRGVNGSETVARRLEGGLVAGHRLAVLVMAVRWGEPERTIPARIAELRPVLVIGLGEGHPDRIACEQRASNRVMPLPDEAGKLPPAALLDAAAADHRPATLRCDAAWFTDLALPVPLQTSQDAGGYLCNAALWTLAGSGVPRSGFLHLPPQGAASGERYGALLAPVVLRLITRNLEPGG